MTKTDQLAWDNWLSPEAREKKRVRQEKRTGYVDHWARHNFSLVDDTYTKQVKKKIHLWHFVADHLSGDAADLPQSYHTRVHFLFCLCSVRIRLTYTEVHSSTPFSAGASRSYICPPGVCPHCYKRWYKLRERGRKLQEQKQSAKRMLSIRMRKRALEKEDE
jgi:hypothetical protein